MSPRLTAEGRLNKAVGKYVPEKRETISPTKSNLLLLVPVGASTFFALVGFDFMSLALFSAGH